MIPILIISEGAPKPILPSNLMPRTIRFLDLAPIEVARQVNHYFIYVILQITVSQFNEFRKATPEEYIFKRWTDKYRNTPIRNLVESFNKVLIYLSFSS